MLDLKEQLQEDLMAVLDGLPNKAISAACQIVVDRFNEHQIDPIDPIEPIDPIVENALVLSTSHLPCERPDWGTMGHGLSDDQMIDFVMVCNPTYDDVPSLIEKINTFAYSHDVPSWIEKINTFAYNHGCTFIVFDPDGIELPEFEKYDW